VSAASGEIENEDALLVIKRIHVSYRLRIEPGADRAKIQRAFANHMPRCPVYRSIGGSIDITTSLDVVEE